jgi:hypothetical protein
LVNLEKDVYKSIVVMHEDAELIVSEGDKIQFVNEFTGEQKIGTLTKISGKGEKTKLQIIPQGSQCEEVWSVVVIAENSLKLFVEE